MRRIRKISADELYLGHCLKCKKYDAVLEGYCPDCQKKYKNDFEKELIKMGWDV